MFSANKFIKEALNDLQKMPTVTANILFLFILAIIVFIDFYTKYQVEIFICYMLPLLVLTLRGQLKAAYLFVFVCPLISEIADYFSNKPYDYPSIAVWTFFIRLFCLFTFVLLLSSLLRQYNKYKEYFDLEVIGLAQLSKQMQFIDANKHLLQILGYSCKELNQINLIDMLQSNGFYEYNSKIINSILSCKYKGNFDTKIKRKDGCVIHVNISLGHIVNFTKETKYIIAAFQDVTENKKLMYNVIQNDKMMTIGRITAGIAHQINNPLSIISKIIKSITSRLTEKSIVNLMSAQSANINFDNMQSYLAKREIIPLLEIVNDSVNSSTSIVSDLLKFSKKDNSEKRFCDIIKLLDNSLELLFLEAKTKNEKIPFKNIEKRYLTNSITYLGYPIQLQQVFYNILSNAFDATKEISHPKIIITAQKTDNSIVIVFKDNGHGMEEEVLRSIFEPFYTTKSFNSSIGIGLYIALLIIKNNHNGQIVVNSSLKSGSEFIITIPC